MDPDDIDEEDDEGMPQVIIGDPDPAAVEWNVSLFPGSLCSL